MNKKYFVFGDKTELSKEERERIRIDQERRLKEGDDYENQEAKRRLAEEDNLVHVEDRIVVKVDMKGKDSHTFESGLTIRRERNFNNFNRRETQPVNAIVISGEGIPKNAEILVDHNAFHETNRVNDYKNRFEKEDSDRVRYFSLPRYECYAWRLGAGGWTPIYPFEFGLMVFEPYRGVLQGIEPKVVKDTLYVLSGELKGSVVKTLKGCNYIIVYQDLNGRENYLLTFRPFGDTKRKMEEEAVAILHDETKKVKNGELLVGFSVSDAKPLNELV